MFASCLGASEAAKGSATKSVNVTEKLPRKTTFRSPMISLMASSAESNSEDVVEEEDSTKSIDHLYCQSPAILAGGQFGICRPHSAGPTVGTLPPKRIMNFPFLKSNSTRSVTWSKKHHQDNINVRYATSDASRRLSMTSMPCDPTGKAPDIIKPQPINNLSNIAYAAARRLSIVSMPCESSGESPDIIKPQPIDYSSVTGANLNMDWLLLKHVEFYVDGGHNWLYSAELDGKPVVVKIVKPRARNDPLAIEDLERELRVHASLDHENIVELVGAGLKPQGERFIVLEKLDGGTLSDMLDLNRNRTEKKTDQGVSEPLSYIDVLKHARWLSAALQYCHSKALPGSMILHRDLKPENVAFSADGLLKIIDFGLAKVVENASSDSNDIYVMSGKTGSYRYMSPEVALTEPYNHKADVYSFGKA